MWPSLDEIWKIMQFRHYNTYLKNKRNFQLSDYFAQTTHCKSSLKIILRGEPTFYDQRLVSIGNFGTSYWVQLWSPKNWFCSLFSLITKSILTLYCLRIPKQLVSRICKKWTITSFFRLAYVSVHSLTIFFHWIWCNLCELCFWDLFLDMNFIDFFTELSHANGRKQSSRGVLRKSCSKNMQQIYGRATIPKCDFNC